MEQMGFASSNVVFGVGSFTYQYVTRDTFGFAVKSTYGEINHVGQDIFKDPKTDDGTKKSAKGILKVIKENGKYKLIDQVNGISTCELRPVFSNGKLLINEKYSDIRERALKTITENQYSYRNKS